AGGTPAGSYLLEVQVERPDGSSIDHRPARLTYGLPLVGNVTLAPISLLAAADGAVSAQAPLSQDFGPLRLAAWQPPDRAEQGGFLPFGLWWTASTEPSKDWLVSIRLVDCQGQVWASHVEHPRAGYNPTAVWSVGELQRDVQMVM